jgi:hypothetical protein
MIVSGGSALIAGGGGDSVEQVDCSLEARGGIH